MEMELFPKEPYAGSGGGWAQRCSQTGSSPANRDGRSQGRRGSVCTARRPLGACMTRNLAVPGSAVSNVQIHGVPFTQLH